MRAILRKFRVKCVVSRVSSNKKRTMEKMALQMIIEVHQALQKGEDTQEWCFTSVIFDWYPEKRKNERIFKIALLKILSHLKISLCLFLSLSPSLSFSCSLDLSLFSISLFIVRFSFLLFSLSIRRLSIPRQNFQNLLLGSSLVRVRQILLETNKISLKFMSWLPNFWVNCDLNFSEWF